jgi:hypothetical protein
MNNTAIDETQTTSQASNRRPTHVAYWVRGRDNKKSEWRPIGVAWMHGDGKGINIQVDLIPLDGRITLRAAEDKTQ